MSRTDFIVAKDAHGAEARKTIRCDDGVISVKPYPLSKNVIMDEGEILSFPDMCRVLDKISENPDLFLMRAKRTTKGTSPQLRRSKARHGEPATVADTLSVLLILDLDKVIVRGDVKKAPLQVIEEIRATLPPSLQGAKFWFQFSASAGLTKGEASVRVVFCLSDRMSNKEVKRIIAAHNFGADTAIYKETQPIYFGPPKFIGMVDPLLERSGVWEVGSDTVDVASLRASAEAPQLISHLTAGIRSLKKGTPRHPEINRASFRAGKLVKQGLDRDVIIEELVEASQQMEDPKPAHIARDEIERAVDDGARDKSDNALGLSESKDGRPIGSLSNAITILGCAAAWAPTLALNRRAQRVRIMVRPPLDADLDVDRDYPCDLVDSDFSRIRAQFERRYGLTVTKAVVAEAVTVVAHRHSFDPLADYLSSCPPGNEGRIEMALIRWFGLKDTAHNRAASRILMLSAVKRGLHPGSKVDTIVVFVGPQGVGKSSGIIAIFGEEFVAQGLSQLGTKDALIEMMEPWVIELAELDALSRREHATIKAVLTRTEDILRLPYERVTTRSPRGCVFVGTTNEAVPLQDPTGGRRFIMVDVKRANIKRIHAERDAVFGEAVQRLSEGEPWHPTVEEEALFAEARESKYAGDPWEDDVAEALESLERRELLRNHVPTRVILNELPHPANGHTRADELRLGKVMPRLGYESVRLPASIHPRRPRGWFKDIGKPGISEARPSNIATLMEDL